MTAHLRLFSFRLLKALAHDLRTTMVPMYLSLIQELLPLLLRKLNPAAFEELLATLLAIFKYILIPSLPSTNLRDTWQQLRRPFIESSPDGCRMLGELWGAVVRRLTSDERTKLVSMMVYSLFDEPELRDGIAWVFVTACQVGLSSTHLDITLKVLLSLPQDPFINAPQHLCQTVLTYI